MIELFQRTNWSELYYFFAKGDPPLAMVLLVLNTLFFMLWIARRMRGAHTMRSETVIAVQSLLIGSNAVIMFREDVMRITQASYYWHKLMAGIPSF